MSAHAALRRVTRQPEVGRRRETGIYRTGRDLEKCVVPPGRDLEKVCRATRGSVASQEVPVLQRLGAENGSCATSCVSSCVRSCAGPCGTAGETAIRT